MKKKKMESANVIAKLPGSDPKLKNEYVVLSAHIDHIGGLADAKGKRFFPNATIHISKADYDFWTDEKKLGDKFALGKLTIDALRTVFASHDAEYWEEWGRRNDIPIVAVREASES